ncbi:MAG: hypothetical protein ABI370_08525 [Gammaproteobacteria bacterium]
MMRSFVDRLRFAGMHNLLQIAGVMLITILPVILICLYDPAFFNCITQNITLHPMPLRLFRWGMILFFMFFWPYIVRKFGKHCDASEGQIIGWQAEIFRIAMWVIIFEFLACENILSKLIYLW